jgi:hypothetical protein
MHAEATLNIPEMKTDNDDAKPPGNINLELLLRGNGRSMISQLEEQFEGLSAASPSGWY